MKIFVKHAENGEKKGKKKHGCFWTVIILVLVYCGFCGWLGYYLSDTSYSLESNSVYELKMDGVVNEQATEDNPLASLLGEVPGYGNSPKVVGLDELLSNIQLAKEDDRIEGILLKGGSLHMGPATAKAIRDALLDYKESGKWIIAYASDYSQLNYYVASVADSIYLNPTGSIAWNGLGGQKTYYTRILEKLGIEMQILKVGTFKSAVEPFIRTSMSEADKHQTMQYLNGIWDEMVASVGAARGIESEVLNQYADECMSLQPQEKYIAYNMVDSLIYAQQLDSILKAKVGSAPTKVSTADLTQVKRNTVKSKNVVAVLYAEGEITDKSGDGIVGTRMQKTIGKILKDNDVKALVLRVNSPGGSADASEQIWHALKMLQTDKNIPVVVSMGDYAASGGYYISCGADYIVAEPTTLTGSIGIFGMIPNYSKLRDKIGIDVDGIGTNRHSLIEANMVTKGMNPEEYALMQNMIERGYDLFTRRCAEGRNMSQDDIKKIAEGRVWLGKDALEIGLVDTLGNIQTAIDKAAELAELGDDYVLDYWPEQEDFLTTVLRELDNSSDEEKLILKIKQLCEKPRVMAKMDEIEIR